MQIWSPAAMRKSGGTCENIFQKKILLDRRASIHAVPQGIKII